MAPAVSRRGASSARARLNRWRSASGVIPQTSRGFRRAADLQRRRAAGPRATRRAGTRSRVRPPLELRGRRFFERRGPRRAARPSPNKSAACDSLEQPRAAVTHVEISARPCRATGPGACPAGAVTPGERDGARFLRLNPRRRPGCATDAQERDQARVERGMDDVERDGIAGRRRSTSASSESRSMEAGTLTTGDRDVSRRRISRVLLR